MEDLNNALSLALGKVVIAAAWADGTVQSEERECLRDLLFQMPELGHREWCALNEILDEPVSRVERDRWIRDLNLLLSKAHEVEFAIYALERVVRADGIVTPEEIALLRDIGDELAGHSPHTMELLADLIDDPIDRRRERECNPEGPFIPDPREELQRSMEADIPSRFSRKQTGNEVLNLGGVLLARVLPGDHKITMKSLSALCHEYWLERKNASDYLARVAVQQKAENYDFVRVCRLFYDATSEADREKFLTLLFAVAALSGEDWESRFDELLNIAATIRLDHLQFEQARSTIFGDEAA